MARALSSKDILTCQDLSRQDIRLIFDTTRELKHAFYRGDMPRLLDRKTLGMIFEEPSTRTRVSFEVAMVQLGGHALYLRPGEIHLGVRETIADTARVLSRYVDAIMARLLKHETLEELARYSRVPVINGLTDWFHPVQALTDVYTMEEKFGDLKKIKVSFFGDATNVANSLLVLCSRLGMNFTFCGPKKYWPKERVMKMVEENISETGANINLTEDIDEAIKGANVVYTDLWWWVGQEHEAEERKRAFALYQVNSALMKKADKNAVFMHCLPAARGMEVTDDVIDGPWSIVWDQAENRLHVEKAILALLIGR
ncbi:ornithine carbamoyltransferase [Candidatus Methanodesulfokora washburnensis]|jgi:ornithine carbamoyltransferase|uniref:Ornithine carbamoyltransferase n=1 Tax=Candidatus Methanodesulfokora washburnensis TaxID=2478471 RepID=A0A3R9PV96_9CREN|nr:ornithine carbamoyltransferase [Candidatus Methanodesulfokores washburnensis]RSN74028.1 ornithine carbamoyltransferase [Candidatus Methanodesulfokores washburnensis]